MKWQYRPAIAAALLTVLGACATYSDWVGLMEREMAAEKPDAALEILDKHLDGRRDRVLYLLNRAMLLRMAGRFEDSNRAFEMAKTLIDQLMAVSVSEQGGAFTVNEMMRSYTGEPFERIFLHVYAALNYLELGRPADARVEVLQMDGLLNGLEEKALPGTAFARYLSGLVYETLGEWDDALIDYRKAFQAYARYPEAFHATMPAQLKSDLLRLTRRVGLTEEYADYERRWGGQAAPAPEDGKARGELVFLLHSGLAPLKFSENVSAVTPDGELVTLSMPYYVPRAAQVISARLYENGGAAATQMYEDVGALAQYTLERRKPVLLARAIARAALKHEATEAARKQDDALGFIVNMAGVLSERADTRAWTTLPGRILLARMPLEPGSHVIRVELKDRSGKAVAEREYAFDLGEGDKHFISLHWVGGQVAAEGRRH